MNVPYLALHLSPEARTKPSPQRVVEPAMPTCPLLVLILHRPHHDGQQHNCDTVGMGRFNVLLLSTYLQTAMHVEPRECCRL